MITICQAYNDFKGANNTWQQAHFRPNSFVYAMHEASLEMFNERRKLIGNNQDITDELRPFLTSVQIPVQSFARGGVIRYPKNYSRFEALRYFVSKSGGEITGDGPVGSPCSDLKVMDKNGRCKPYRVEDQLEAQEQSKMIEKRITKIDSGKWASFQEHEFLGPSKTNIGCCQHAEGFIVDPSEIGYVVLDYLAIPERPKFAYKRDANDNIICLPAQCKDLLWNEELLPELMSRVKRKYASFISNERKYGEAKQEISDAG